MPDKSNNAWKNVGIGAVMFLAFFFAYFTFNNSNSYKKQIKSLESEKKHLEEKLENSVNKDSILYFIKEQESLEFIINILQSKIDSIKDKRYEKTNYTTISVDSNIIILSKKLSSEVSPR